MTEAAVIERHGGIAVVRDDLLEGGSKIRFLDALVPDDAKEVVFGGPCYGGAPLALSVLGRRRGIAVSLFYAKRNNLLPRQRRAADNGAKIVEVPFGYMSHVQSEARRYAADSGALFLPLGFDVPRASDVFIEAITAVRVEHGLRPREVWCATGSGMLARSLGLAFPDSSVIGVAVGLASRWSRQEFPSNVAIRQAPWSFEHAVREGAPFDSCPNYDRKAWLLCAADVSSAPTDKLFWNVMGES